MFSSFKHEARIQTLKVSSKAKVYISKSFPFFIAEHLGLWAMNNGLKKMVPHSKDKSLDAHPNTPSLKES